jgi:RNA 2',3'-cyclic 3'-phosphodiesterase
VPEADQGACAPVLQMLGGNFMKINPHYFLAVPIEKEQQMVIQSWLASNKKKLPFQSWVHQQDYHITLAFLGHIDSDIQLTQLSSHIKRIGENIKPFMLSLKGLDVFGKADAPRIFWASVADSEALQDLQKQVIAACRECGFTLDSKPFRPHITLARKWKSECAFVKKEEYNHIFQGNNIPFQVRSIHLYRTHLDRVPKYETMEIFPFQGEI